MQTSSIAANASPATTDLPVVGLPAFFRLRPSIQDQANSDLCDRLSNALRDSRRGDRDEDLMQEIRSVLRSREVLKAAVPEQFQLLRALQFAAHIGKINRRMIPTEDTSPAR